MFNVFITNLGKYNEGELVGKWLELPCDNLEAELESIGVAENTMYEEYFITDYENDYDYKVGEYASLERLNDLAETLEALDEYEAAHLQAYMEASGDDLEEALKRYENSIFYKGMDLVDVAYLLVEECYDLPEMAQRYFDYEAFARDLGFEGYYETEVGTICLC